MAMIPVYNWQTRQIEFVDDGQNADGQAQQQQPGGAGGIANIGGMAGGRYVGNQIFGGGSAAASAPIASNAGSSPLTSALGGTPVATAADGSTLTTMSPEVIPGAGATSAPTAGSFWTSAPENGSAGQIASGAAAAYGTYRAIDDWQHGGSGRAGLTTAGAGVGNIIGGPVGGAIGAAYGNIMGYGLQGKGWKNHVALALTNPALEAGRLMGWSPVRKTTKQYEAERTQDLLDMSDDKDWQNTVMHFRSVEHPEGDKGENFSAKDALAANNKDGKVLWGSSAMLKQFGPDYFTKLSEPQREELSRTLSNRGLISNSKGDWQIKDSDAANAIRDEILSGKKKEEAKSASDPLSLDGFNSKFGNSWNQARGGG